MTNKGHRLRDSLFRLSLLIFLSTSWVSTAKANDLLIADTHVHYSHDSVELTPPERVIELMRGANLKFALVSSSDDNGTQLLSGLAPDLIVPSLRPYRRRGELRSWFTDADALAYVEDLLTKNVYAAIGEFHLFGSDADLEIPRRIVELAEEHNLILHAHSDAEAVERLLAQSDEVKVIWAHSGFEDPEAISDMLYKYDRLWADLAFRSEVGSGGSLSDEWRTLFEDHPDRMMLGTDTYTPERMYFIPEHADNARRWLSGLPRELAEKVAWRNGYNLIMPIWETNRDKTKDLQADASPCSAADGDAYVLEGDAFTAALVSDEAIAVSSPTALIVTICGDVSAINDIAFDAVMPAHGHGTNYTPKITNLETHNNHAVYRIEGLILHMPGKWQWEMDISSGNGKETLTNGFTVR